MNDDVKNVETILGLPIEEIKRLVNEAFENFKKSINGSDILSFLMVFQEEFRAYESAPYDTHVGFIQSSGHFLPGWWFDRRIIAALLKTPFLRFKEYAVGNSESPHYFRLYELTEEGRIFWERWGKSAYHQDNQFWTIICQTEDGLIAYPFVGSYQPNAIDILQQYGVDSKRVNIVQVSGPHMIRMIPPEAFGLED